MDKRLTIGIILLALLLLAGCEDKTPEVIRKAPMPPSYDFIENVTKNQNSICITMDKAYPPLLLKMSTPSNSMNPAMNHDSTLVYVVPKSESEVVVGSIVAFKTANLETEGRSNSSHILHRVIEISNDSEGWYATTRGDSGLWTDPWKLRFDDIYGLVVAAVYSEMDY